MTTEALYAAHTSVPVSRSEKEAKEIIERWGATGFARLEDDDAGIVVIRFSHDQRDVQFMVRRPSEEEGGEKEHRRLWRVLCLSLKAKFAMVESGLVSFQEEFLAHILLPGSNQTVAALANKEIDQIYNGVEARGSILGLLDAPKKG